MFSILSHVRQSRALTYTGVELGVEKSDRISPLDSNEYLIKKIKTHDEISLIFSMKFVDICVSYLNFLLPEITSRSYLVSLLSYFIFTAIPDHEVPQVYPLLSHYEIVRMFGFR